MSTPKKQKAEAVKPGPFRMELPESFRALEGKYAILGINDRAVILKGKILGFERVDYKLKTRFRVSLQIRDKPLSIDYETITFYREADSPNETFSIRDPNQWTEALIRDPKP